MPTGVYLLLGLVAGAVLGFLFGWLYGRGRVAPQDDRLSKELRENLQRRETELNQVRAQLTEAAKAAAAADAGRVAADKRLEDQKVWHEKALADLHLAFRGLSAEALKQSAPEFLRLAEQSFGKLQEAAKGDLNARQESIRTLVKPLEEHLKTYQQRLQESESKQTAALGAVKQQLETLNQQSQALAQETQQFRSVLKSNQARGRWGEETLRRVVEAAGMSAHCDFSEQTPSGEGKPDLIVRLPGERIIIVDAKVPDLDFLSALETADPAKRSEILAAHASKLKSAIKNLADRDYPTQFPNALDYVVLFLPAESLFSAALEGDRDLIVWAASKRILLATPASLIALLRSVSVSWQQHAQTENTQKIAEAAKSLYERVVIFVKHFEKIRDGLDATNRAYNEAVRSFEARVMPASKKLSELGGGTEGKTLPELKPLEAPLHQLPLLE
jgi:DNA recombination protein RmuC